MLIETCGETFDTAAIVAKRHRGAPLTFGEVMALKYGMQTRPTGTPAAVTVAKHAGARLALVAKAANGRETVIAYANPDKTVKAVVWAEVEKLAAAERDKNPQLTREQSAVVAMDSDAGRPLMELYRSGDAQLTASEWVAKAARGSAPAMSSKRTRVESLACALAAEQHVTREQARSRVWAAHPELREG